MDRIAEFLGASEIPGFPPAVPQSSPSSSSGTSASSAKAKAAPEAAATPTAFAAGRNITYATMLCNESYFNGVLVLIKTMRKHCAGCRSRAIPITIMVDRQQVSKATRTRLKSLCEHMIEVDTLLGPQKPNTSAVSTNNAATAATDTAAASSAAQGCWAASEMTKLRLWEQTQFDGIFYIDADCMVLDCVDEVFDRCASSTFAAAPDVFPPDRFNAGVFYLKPSAETFQQLCAALHTLPSYDGGDTGFLNAFYADWYAGPCAARLPFGFNMQRTLYWFTYSVRPGYWDSIQPKKIVHFSSSPKPWDTSMDQARGDLEWQWWQTLMLP